MNDGSLVSGPKPNGQLLLCKIIVVSLVGLVQIAFDIRILSVKLGTVCVTKHGGKYCAVLYNRIPRVFLSRSGLVAQEYTVNVVGVPDTANQS